MKKTLINILAISLLPIFAGAGIFKVPESYNMIFSNGFGRGYRLTQRIENTFIDYLWEPDSRAVPIYSEDYPSRVVSLRSDYWEDDAWQEGVMDTQISYNEQGRATELVSTYHIMGFDIPMLKQSSEYDAQSRLIHTSLYSGSIENIGVWNPVMRMNFVYGAGTSFEVYGWNDDSGDEETDIYYTHVVFDFDAQGRILEDVSYTSPDSLNWVMDSKSTYTYHPQDPTTGSDIIEMIANQFTMMLLMEGDFLPGKITLQTYYDWIGGEWQLSGRDHWEYNIPLQITSHLNEDYDGNGWQPMHWTQYFYDHDGLLHYVTRKWWDDSAWNEESKTDYYWEQYTANSDLVAPLPRLDFRVQPNPFVDKLRVETDTGKNAPLLLEVYNLRGQKLYHSTANSNEFEWNGADLQGKTLPAGVYFVRLSQDGTSGTKRVLKLK